MVMQNKLHWKLRPKNHLLDIQTIKLHERSAIGMDRASGGTSHSMQLCAFNAHEQTLQVPKCEPHEGQRLCPTDIHTTLQSEVLSTE